ncbi:TolC family protein [Foetidibacter luteolus]|uniref:TolC family protein n=1 Tax=Foetidibacter luteolus TaxID=2608880 RepID=UPI00129B000E|nr:TolC family protein [Foetidibacter luteolus]
MRMLRLERILLIIALGLAGNTAFGQLRFSSLEDIWGYADKHSTEIQAARNNRLIAEKSLKQAYGSMLPSVTANGSFTDNVTIQSTLIPATLFNPAAPEGTFTEATFGRRYIYNANINTQFDILNMQDWFAVKAAKFEKEMATLNIEKSRRDLYARLADAYFSCLLLNEAERITLEDLNTTTVVYNIARNKFNDGLVSGITLNTALINKSKAEKSLGVIAENRKIQLNNLRLLLNCNDSIYLPETLPLKVQVVDSISFLPDPEIGLANTEMLVAMNNWKSSKAAFSPVLSAVYQYNTQVASDELLKFGNSNTIPQQYWGLRLSVPIFTGGTRKYQLDKSRLEYETRRTQYEAAKLQSSISNSNILLSYNSSLKAYQKSVSILELYESNDRHAQNRLQEGVVSLDERLRSYSDLTASQNEYLQSMSDYFIQAYKLKIKLLGMESK